MVPPDTPTQSAAPPSATPTPAAAAAAVTAGTPGTPPTAGTAGTAKPPTPAWAEWLNTTASSLYAWLIRPRVRLTVTGALLLLVGGVIATNTVWTLPLVIIGALMVAVAWLGHRLEGRFAVEWGESGTQLAFKATIKAPQPTTDMPALRAASPAAPQPRRTAPVALAKSSDDVIEGEAHTVEINVAELKALIAAAEAAETAATTATAETAATGETGETPEASVREIRIRRLADEPDRTPRPAG